MNDQEQAEQFASENLPYCPMCQADRPVWKVTKEMIDRSFLELEESQHQYVFTCPHCDCRLRIPVTDVLMKMREKTSQAVARCNRGLYVVIQDIGTVETDKSYEGKAYCREPYTLGEIEELGRRRR